MWSYLERQAELVWETSFLVRQANDAHVNGEPVNEYLRQNRMDMEDR
jgi:hypothetical protein